jgi:hypothetical protein
MAMPTPPKPSRIIAPAEGSGTGMRAGVLGAETRAGNEGAGATVFFPSLLDAGPWARAKEPMVIITIKTAKPANLKEVFMIICSRNLSQFIRVSLKVKGKKQ